MTKAWIPILNLVAWKLKLKFFQKNKNKMATSNNVFKKTLKFQFIHTYSFKCPQVEACFLLLYSGNSHNLGASQMHSLVYFCVVKTFLLAIICFLIVYCLCLIFQEGIMLNVLEKQIFGSQLEKLNAHFFVLSSSKCSVPMAVTLIVSLTNKWAKGDFF